MINNNLIINESATFQEGIEQLNQNGQGVLFGVDDKKKLKYVITDGDIRRAALNMVELSSSLSRIGNKNFYFKLFPCNKQKAINYLKGIKRRHLPLLDENGIIKEIVILGNITVSRHENLVVILAGGLGTRLRPLTDYTPKPLLGVGGKPILERIINSFTKLGFYRFLLAVNYKREMIEEYFGDGNSFECEITYLYENKKLGTAGPLSNIQSEMNEPIIVMNGDLLTTVNFEQLLEFHKDTDSVATMCVREYEYQVPYGVIETDNHKLLTIVEKPVYKSFVNAGIYVLNPETLKYVPTDKFYDMPDLFKRLMVKESKVMVFPINEYWLDIGRLADYEKADDDFYENLHD